MRTGLPWLGRGELKTSPEGSIPSGSTKLEESTVSDKTDAESIHDRQRESYVIVVEHGRDGAMDKLVKEMGPHPRWKAEKVDDGVNINMNHDSYYTLILTKKELERWKSEHASS